VNLRFYIVLSKSCVSESRMENTCKVEPKMVEKNLCKEMMRVEFRKCAMNREK